MAPHRTQQRLFGQQRRPLERAANAHSNHNGRTGIGTRLSHSVQHEFLYAVLPVGRLEHGEPAHILRAKSLGRNGDFQPVAGHQADMQYRRCIIAGVAPANGIQYNAFAQKSFGVSFSHSRVNGGLKIAFDVYVLSDLTKNAGHAGVLANGQPRALGGIQVFTQGAQGALRQRPGLRGSRLPQRVFQIGRKRLVGLNAQAGHGVAHFFGQNGSHRRATPVSRAALATASATALATRASNAPGRM